MTDSTAKGLTRAILQMPEPMRRLLLSALFKEAPDMIPEIEKICRLWVPYLNLNESRRTTMTEQPETGPRFAAVVITAETDSGDLFAWPNFMMEKLPQHDLHLLELSLTGWLEIVRRQIRDYGRPVGEGSVRTAKVKVEKKEDLPDIDMSDYE